MQIVLNYGETHAECAEPRRQIVLNYGETHADCAELRRDTCRLC